MSERIRDFAYGAIYRAKSRNPSASAPRFNCFTPAKAYVADCWVCDAFGRIDPSTEHHPHHQHPPKMPVDVTVTL